MGKSFEGLRDIIKTGLGVAFGNIVTKPVEAFFQLIKKGVQDALDFEQSLIVLNQQVSNAGDLMAKLQGSTNGLVDDLTLARSATRALSFGLQEEAIPALAETAVALGKIQGLDPSQAFNDIVVGIARASPLILDNLGIVLDAETTYTAYAESIGTTSKELTKQQKLLALQNRTIQNARTQVLQQALATKTAKEELQEFNVAFNNFLTDIGTGGIQGIKTFSKEQANLNEALKEGNPVLASAIEVNRGFEAQIIKTILASTLFKEELEETTEANMAFENSLDFVNAQVTEQLRVIGILETELKTYKDQLKEATAEFETFIGADSQDRVDNDRELNELLRDQVVIRNALKEAGLEDVKLEGLVIGGDELKKVNELLDEYNDKFDSNIEFNSTIGRQIEDRKKAIEEENELLDAQNKVTQDTAAIRQEEIAPPVRPQTEEDRFARISTFFDKDLPAFNKNITDVTTQIEDQRLATDQIAQNFALSQSSTFLIAENLEKIDGILKTLGNVGIDANVSVTREEDVLIE